MNGCPVPRDGAWGSTKQMSVWRLDLTPKGFLSKQDIFELDISVSAASPPCPLSPMKPASALPAADVMKCDCLALDRHIAGTILAPVIPCRIGGRGSGG